MVDVKQLAPENIRAIAPYIPGKPISETAREIGLAERDILKMASNESPLGPSPKAVEAIRGWLGQLHLYPESAFDLKGALSRKLGVGGERLVLGNGSNDVLEIAARTFLRAGDSVVFAQHAFLVYPLVAQVIGATQLQVPARGFGADLDAMLAAIRPDTRMVFLANPNNPTGTLSAWDDVRAFVQRVPANVFVVLDEAYGEYLPDELRSPTLSWLRDFPNLMVMRTLSKAYGLAGLRVGFAVAHPDAAELMNRVRQPFNVNQLALVAATAALDDEAFIARSRDVNAKGLAQLREGFERLGLEYIPSYGNFITVRIGNANAVYMALLREGVIVRPVANYGMPEHLRVTVGLPEHNARFLAALGRAFGKR